MAIFTTFVLLTLLLLTTGQSAIKKQVWEVGDNELDKVLDVVHHLSPTPDTLAEDDDRLDEVALCVEVSHCTNTDGEGVIVPRDKHCPKPKIYCPVDQLVNYPLCGISKPNLIGNRIASTNGDSVSRFGEWPWMAIVMEHHFDIEYYLCTAVIIDNRHLLTVAHCFDNVEVMDIVVRLGEYDIHTETEPLPPIDVDVEIIAVHDNYTKRNLHNDIAVIRLKNPIDFAEHIQPICLPNPIQVRQHSKSKQRCVISGWGHTETGGFLSNVPKKVSVPMIENHECQRLLRKTKLGRRFKLHRTFLCAGGEVGNDACTGDGGGPLMCQDDDGTFSLVGLVSWGLGCGLPDVPGVYTNVLESLQFIERVTSFLDHFL